MALLRVLHGPCATDFSFHHDQILLSSTSPQIQHFYKPLQLNNVISFPSLSLKIPSKSQRLNLYQLHVSSSIEAEAVTESPEDVENGEQEEEEFSKTRILAQNVPWTCTADDIRPLFEKYGTVVDVELSMFNKTRNRGLAFVTMGSPEEAQAAFSNLESYEYAGRVLKLNWAKPKKIKPPPPKPKPKTLPIHNLYVANVSFQARAKDLKEFFNANNGNVVSAEIIFQDKPRRSAGYGFVSFNTKEDAEAALTAFQGKEFMGRPIRVARSRTFLRPQTKVALNGTGEEPESLDKVD
ncbi:OLC1v1017326C1 [Oldenlandia corymbosa var. corymbosa]|uniref:OLC1v1017326C1 n=1 Tax=Oldenlandia corymbosa var. corymbosa TaxID=529605 RepID=A0AAV1E9C5_OLDCO|nr:OLC1v1017326C1 [Oldenlandia corymbosa var. corymbosa]